MLTTSPVARATSPCAPPGVAGGPGAPAREPEPGADRPPDPAGDLVPVPQRGHRHEGPGLSRGTGGAQCPLCHSPALDGAYPGICLERTGFRNPSAICSLGHRREPRSRLDGGGIGGPRGVPPRELPARRHDRLPLAGLWATWGFPTTRSKPELREPARGGRATPILGGGVSPRRNYLLGKYGGYPWAESAPPPPDAGCRVLRGLAGRRVPAVRERRARACAGRGRAVRHIGRRAAVRRRPPIRPRTGRRASSRAGPTCSSHGTP